MKELYKEEKNNKYDFKGSEACTIVSLDETQNIIQNELTEEEKLLFKVRSIEREFAQHLIKLRKENGLTQADMAKRTGLTQQAISTLEKCDRKPTLPNLIRYLLGLDIDINKIFN